MSKVKCVLAFIFGAAVGSVVTWKVLDTRYEQLIQEEVASVKKHLGKQHDKDIDIDAEEDELEQEYFQKTEQYSNDKNLSKPYIIHPDEFGMCEYETYSLHCYADRVVTDLDDEIIENVEILIGDKSLDHFGEYEPDAVYVRNDKLKRDYEILLKGQRYYTDVAHKKPHRAED